jgi:hypothetical protein
VVEVHGGHVPIVPAFVLLYALDQTSLLPEEGMPEPARRA